MLAAPRSARRATAPATAVRLDEAANLHEDLTAGSKTPQEASDTGQRQGVFIGAMLETSVFRMLGRCTEAAADRDVENASAWLLST